MARWARRVGVGLLLSALMTQASAPVEASRVDFDTLGVQYNLREMGFDPGPLDGQMGGQTRRALREFQQDRGIAQTGELDSATIDYLMRFSRTREIPMADAVLDRVDDVFNEELIDPGSRTVRSMRLFRMWDEEFNAYDFIVCGEVNARNRFGGFTGWRPFVIRILAMDADVENPVLGIGFLDTGQRLAPSFCRWNYYYLPQ